MAAVDVTSKNLDIVINLPKPTLSLKVYGIKTWDASGNVTLDPIQDVMSLIYSADVAAGTSGNTTISALDGRKHLCFAIVNEAGGTHTANAPHVVWREAGTNTIYWEPAAETGETACASTVMVFVWG